ncbi:hypothetical protein Lrub_0149 [Legionella rubrilucens]|uniref:Uncharacterized protein n=2 Tax=Legionella rubrilucens TaxID=458 RepID=A0A0W0Y0F1_9GAMM|nr:hypothetical protein [Legionella rubrilucens]KTD50525.1 hypothetical protein Lrub_0149 [Legionella rubrilucens]
METVTPMDTPIIHRDTRMDMDRISPMVYPHTSTSMATPQSFFHPRRPLSFNRLCINTITMVIPIPIPMVTEAATQLPVFR